MDVFDIHGKVVQNFDLELVPPALLLFGRDFSNDLVRHFDQLLLHVFLTKYVFELPILLRFRCQNQVHSLQLNCHWTALNVEEGNFYLRHNRQIVSFISRRGKAQQVVKF